MANPVNIYSDLTEQMKDKSVDLMNLDSLNAAVRAVRTQENAEGALPQLQIIAERKKVKIPPAAFADLTTLENAIAEERDIIERTIEGRADQQRYGGGE